MKTPTVLLAIGLFAVAAVAAEVSGKWVAEITGPSGSMSERIFTFKVSASKLTGTVINQSVDINCAVPSETLKTQMGTPQEISEGKVSGNDISFTIISQMIGSEIRTVYRGKISGNEIKFTAETKYPEGMISRSGSPMQPPPPQKFVAMRVSP